MLSKKGYIVPFIFLILSISLGYALLHVEKSPSKNISPDFLFRPGESSQSVPLGNCKSDAVEYYAYKEIPPEERKNNKFGLYIYAENQRFIKLASEMVNSNGGDWGYVLIPYNVKDYDTRKWARVFTMLKDEKLIPVIQLYDVDVSKYKKQTQKAAEFLDSFLWPVKQRYISVYNEPNDAKFWKGYTDAKEYAKILDYTIETFKEQNSNFFMMNGAFNVSASAGDGYVDAFDFMLQMEKAVPRIFRKLDGWASHPYPHPNFSGNPHTIGRNGIRAYETELVFLKDSLEVGRDLPVFITETGWAHMEGAKYDYSFLSADQVAQNIKTAYEEYWLPDDRVQAVMPFTIWYPAPFDHFSWVDKEYNPYPQYDVVKSMKKVTGTPEELIIKTYVREDCN